MPAVPQVMGKETPRMPIILRGKDQPHPIVARAWAVRVVLNPENAEEERAGRGHDGDVGQRPPAVVLLQRGDNVQEERVIGHGAHCIVGYAGWEGAAQKGWIGEEGVETTLAALLVINIWFDVG